MAEQRLKLLCKQLGENDVLATDICDVEFGRIENAFTLLGGALVGNKSLLYLVITSADDFSADEAEQLSIGIRQSSIKCLTFLGNGRRLPLPFVNVTSALPSLEELFLAFIILDNQRLFTLSPHVRNLVINQVQFTVRAAQVWAAAIVASDKLQQVQLHGVGEIQDERVLLEAVVQSSSIQTVQLGRVFTESLPLVAMIANRVSHLTFARDHGGGAFSAMLDAIFTEGTIVTSLHFTEINFRADDVAHLVRGLKTNTTLTRLSFLCCSLQPEGAAATVRALVDHPRLCSLSLLDDPTIGYSGLHQIANQLEKSQFQHVSLRGCVASVHPMPEAETMAKHHAAQALVQALVRNRQLVSLDTTSNDFSEEVERSIQFHVLLNRSAWRTLSVYHESPPSEWHRLLENCTSQDFSSSLVYFYLKERPTLVGQPLIPVEQPLSLMRQLQASSAALPFFGANSIFGTDPRLGANSLLVQFPFETQPRPPLDPME